MDLWKIIFLYNPVVFRFHVNLPECSPKRPFQSNPRHVDDVDVREVKTLQELGQKVMILQGLKSHSRELYTDILKHRSI